jgi:magnesium chelatase family protein
MSKLRLASAKAISLVGLDGHLVDVEAHINNGLPGFTLVGLPDTSLGESKSRVLSAFQATGIRIPEGHTTVNLAPASLPKSGSSFDLAIAIAVLAALRKVEAESVKNVLFVGELGLDGRIHPVRGILPVVASAKYHGIEKVVVPLENEAEAKLVLGVEVVSAGHIFEVINSFGGKLEPIEYKPVERISTAEMNIQRDKLSFSDVLGQTEAKFACELAAAGGHNLLMVGPPGTGKTMLAARIPSILPPLTNEQSLEVTSIHSVAGTLRQRHLIEEPPFEAPHHTATAPAIIGGGSNMPRPGAVSRAHNGVLFLDEAPEFSPRVLQTLRQPLESGEVVIDRAKMKARYPAQFQLIMAANPCPCGMLTSKNSKCRCTSLEKRRYFSRLSGPLLDRIDICIEVPNVSKNVLLDTKPESSDAIRQRVLEARERTLKRLEHTPWRINSQVPGSYIRAKLGQDSEVIKYISGAVDKGVLSMRGADRTLRVAWTIADLEGKASPQFEDIGRALMMKAVLFDEL